MGGNLPGSLQSEQKVRVFPVHGEAHFQNGAKLIDLGRNAGLAFV
jgi:hypothetical protein